MNDSARPQPACGEANYFYPNVPSKPGPDVACVPDGRNRVDLYRFVGLDPLTQQNSVRVAVIDVHRPTGMFGVQAGRFVLPIGFGWRELGSWTNEDAPLIQRLNADASFGALVYARFRRKGTPLARLEAAIVRGDGNRNVEVQLLGVHRARRRYEFRCDHGGSRHADAYARTRCPFLRQVRLFRFEG